MTVALLNHLAAGGQVLPTFCPVFGICTRGWVLVIIPWESESYKRDSMTTDKVWNVVFFCVLSITINHSFQNILSMTLSCGKLHFKTLLILFSGLRRWDMPFILWKEIFHEILYRRSVYCSCLYLPDYKIAFHLYVAKYGNVASALTQMHGERPRPVAHYSKTLPLTVQGIVPCLC